VIRPRRPKHLPIVMTRDEVTDFLNHLDGRVWLVCSLMYADGLRLMECVELRAQDIDFGANQVVVRSGRGFKDRVTVLPLAANGGGSMCFCKGTAGLIGRWGSRGGTTWMNRSFGKQ